MPFTSYELSDSDPNPAPGGKIFLFFLLFIIGLAVGVWIFQSIQGKQ
jgi:hypothetical protein